MWIPIPWTAFFASCTLDQDELPANSTWHWPINFRGCGQVPSGRADGKLRCLTVRMTRRPVKHTGAAELLTLLAALIVDDVVSVQWSQATLAAVDRLQSKLFCNVSVGNLCGWG